MDWTPGQPVKVDTPGAGEGFTYSPSGATPETIRAVSFELTTNGTAGARTVLVSFLDSTGTIVAQASAPFTVAASNTSQFSFTVGGLQYGANNALSIGGPLPDLPIDWRMTLAVTVDNMKPGDQLDNCRVFVCPLPDAKHHHHG